MHNQHAVFEGPGGQCCAKWIEVCPDAACVIVSESDNLLGVV